MKKKSKRKFKYIKKNNYNLFESFKFAFEGIVFALFWERNLRIHFSVVLYLIYFSRKYYTLQKLEIALIIVAIGFVVLAELFNTSIEKTVDLITQDYVRLAKIAKDVAAGAVLVSSITSLSVGFIIFWDPIIVKTIITDMFNYWFVWLPILIANLAVVFLPEFSRRKEAEHEQH